MSEGESRFKIRSLLLYVAIAYAFSWIFWLPQVLAANGVISWSFFAYICGFIAPFGPFVAAITITYRTEGKGAAA